MGWGGPFFVLAIIAMSTTGWVLTSWIRARHGYPLEDSWTGKSGREDADTRRRLDRVAADNERLKQRVEVLERILTDRSTQLGDEIERLRDRPAN